MRYFHTDHLGSVDTITNETGGVVQRLSYDAWGKRRNTNGTDATSITAQTTRGFTRHEHDDEVGLVNMNAREFDPLLGRFITPDTIIQCPYSSQGMNRYTYVNNNPLSFTDPSGHSLRKKLKRAVQKIAKAGYDSWRAPSRAVDHYVTRPAIRHIAKHHPNALPYLRGAAVAVGSFFGGPGGGAAVAAKFDYETCRAMGCDPNDAMRAGLKGGATTYASSYIMGAKATGAHAPWYEQAVVRGIQGGIVSEIRGGEFENGFVSSAGFSVAASAYRSVSGASALSRQASDTNVFGKMMTKDMGREYEAGTATPCFWTCEGGATMSFVNKWLPFGQATGWAHDWTTGSSPVGFPTQFIEGIGTVVPRLASNVSLADFVDTPLGAVYNIGTMLPSYLVTVGAVMDESGAAAFLPQRY